MSDRQRRRTLLLLAGAVAALVVLAGGLPGLEFEPGGSLPVGALASILFPAGASSASSVSMGLVRIVLILVFWVGTPILIIALVVSRELRHHFVRMLPSYIVLAIVLYLLLRFIRELARSNRQGEAAGAGGATQPPLGEQTATLPAMPSFVHSPPPWVVALVTLAVIAVIALIAWRLWVRGHRPAQPTTLDRLTEEAQTALDNLRTGADVRDTVIRCYSEMSRVLREARGVRLSEGMTAREFEEQLRAVGLRDEHIAQLTRLFERVRYGGKASTARDAREAEECLFALVQTYGKALS